MTETDPAGPLDTPADSDPASTPSTPADLGPAADVPAESDPSESAAVPSVPTSAAADSEPTDTTDTSTPGPLDEVDDPDDPTNADVIAAVEALPDKFAAALGAVLAAQDRDERELDRVGPRATPPTPDDTVPVPAGPASPTVSTDPTPAAPPAPPVKPAPADATNDVSHKIGDVVRHDYRDDYRGPGGLDVTDYGTVLDVVPVDLGNGESENRLLVGWFREVSDPMPDSALSSAG